MNHHFQNHLRTTFLRNVPANKTNFFPRFFSRFLIWFSSAQLSDILTDPAVAKLAWEMFGVHQMYFKKGHAQPLTEVVVGRLLSGNTIDSTHYENRIDFVVDVGSSIVAYSEQWMDRWNGITSLYIDPPITKDHVWFSPPIEAFAAATYLALTPDFGKTSIGIVSNPRYRHTLTSFYSRLTWCVMVMVDQHAKENDDIDPADHPALTQLAESIVDESAALVVQTALIFASKHVDVHVSSLLWDAINTRCGAKDVLYKLYQRPHSLKLSRIGEK